MDRIEARERAFPRLIKVLFWVLWTLAFLVMLQVWYFDRSPEVAMVLFFYAAFWVALTYLTARNVFNRAPLVTVDAAGIYDRRIMVRPVPWSEVIRVDSKRASLKVALKSPLKYRRFFNSVPGLANLFATGNITVLYGALDQPAAKITDAVRARLSP
jgi:hypothetical protein